MTSIATVQGASLQGTDITIATGTVVGKNVKSLVIGNKVSYERYVRLKIGGSIVAPVRLPPLGCVDIVDTASGIVLESGEKLEIAAFKKFDFTDAADANDVGYHGWCEDCDDGTGGGSGGGGGSGENPALATFGSGGSATDITQMEFNSAKSPRGRVIIKWGDNSYGAFGGGDAATDLLYNHIETNTDGSFDRAGTVVDIESDFGTLVAYAGYCLEVKKLSANRVAVMLGMNEGGTYKVKWNVYDKNGDGLTKQGNVLSYTCSFNGPNAFNGFGMAVVDENTILAAFADANSQSILKVHPVTLEPSKAKGTSVASSTVTDFGNVVSSAGRTTQGWTDSNGKTRFIFGREQDTCDEIVECTVTVGATPSVTVNNTYNGIGAYLCKFRSAGGDFSNDGGRESGMGRFVINKNDVEVGRAIWVSAEYAPCLYIFGGETNARVISREIWNFGLPGENPDFDYQLIELSYDSSTKWGRYVLAVSDGSTPADNFIYIPFNFNWSSFEMERPTTADDERNTSLTQWTSDAHWGTLFGSSSASNLVTIIDDNTSGSKVKYADQPITIG